MPSHTARTTILANNAVGFGEIGYGGRTDERDPKRRLPQTRKWLYSPLVSMRTNNKLNLRPVNLIGCRLYTRNSRSQRPRVPVLRSTVYQPEAMESVLLPLKSYRLLCRLTSCATRLEGLPCYYVGSRRRTCYRELISTYQNFTGITIRLGMAGNRSAVDSWRSTVHRMKFGRGLFPSEVD